MVYNGKASKLFFFKMFDFSQNFYFYFIFFGGGGGGGGKFERAIFFNLHFTATHETFSGQLLCKKLWTECFFFIFYIKPKTFNAEQLLILFSNIQICVLKASFVKNESFI